MFEKTELLESPPNSLPSASDASSPVTTPITNDTTNTISINTPTLTPPSHELKTEHLKSLKRKPPTTMSLYQKRLRKKAKLQKLLNLKKHNYNSLSTSSSFSSLSSNSSSFSQISDQSTTSPSAVKKDPPMKLHKFYHSVPFKCPFCFTFKEHDTDFISHLATAHYSDVKLLYENRCSTIIDGLNKKREPEAAEKVIKAETDSVPDKVDTTVNSKALYTASTLPPRKQQRLLKSPINDASEIQPQAVDSTQIKSEDYLNYYYKKTNLVGGYSQQNSGFVMPSNKLMNEPSKIDTTGPFYQTNNKNNNNLILAAAASMLNQAPKPSAYNNKSYGSLSSPSEASMKCAICDRGFEYYSNLRRHIKTKHKIFGKQVKEYVIRHQYKTSSTTDNTNPNKSAEDSNIQVASSNSPNNNKNSNDSNANAIMMMSPQSASNQNTSTNYMDLGLLKASSNGKNSPLSSMSSSSLCSVKSLKHTKNSSASSQKHHIKSEDYEEDMDQTEDHASSASSTASFPSFGKTNINSNMAAMAAAVAMNSNGTMPDMSSLISGQSNQGGLSNQMLSLLNSHASAMSKIKSSLLENLLQRKLPSKFVSKSGNASDISSISGSIIGNPNNSQIEENSKSSHLTKLLQNLVDMNQMQHGHMTPIVSSSSPSSSSASSSSSESHEKSQNLFNASFKEENQLDINHNRSSDQDCTENNGSECDVGNELNSNEFSTEFEAKQKDWDGEDSITGFQDTEDSKNQTYYENDEIGNNEEESSGQNHHNHQDICEEDCDENERSRSPSNSSKSSGCSSMSSLIQNQFQLQQKQSQMSCTEAANKLLMSHFAGCITPPINQLTIENHLKNFQQQQRHMMQPNYHPHGNYNSFNANGMKRKKSKEFAMNGFIQSGGLNSVQSPSNVPTDQNNRMINASPASPGSKLDANNQIRYSSEIWRCPYCCYETTSASRYNSHLVCHGWKPYLCPHCGSRSNRLPDMRTHISTFHPEFNVNTFVVLGEEEAKSTLKDYMKNRALINRKLKEMRPQPKFKCKLCPYASLYQFNLTKHVKSVHLNEIYNHNGQGGGGQNGATLSGSA